MLGLPRMKKEYQCASCQKSVFRYDCQLKKTLIVYCSKACVGASKRNGSTLQCKNCGNKFYRRFAEQDIGERVNQFCSNECYFDHRTDHIKPTTYKKIVSRHAHRIIAEQIIGRPLREGEVIHHVDGNKHNNHPSNLALMPDQSTHMKMHSKRNPNKGIEKYLVLNLAQQALTLI